MSSGADTLPERLRRGSVLLLIIVGRKVPEKETRSVTNFVNGERYPVAPSVTIGIKSPLHVVSMSYYGSLCVGHSPSQVTQTWVHQGNVPGHSSRGSPDEPRILQSRPSLETLEVRPGEGSSLPGRPGVVQTNG